MKPVQRYILASFFLTAMILILAVTLGTSKERRSTLVCSGLSVIITDSLENSFVSGKDIKNYLADESFKYKGKKADSIDLVKIEKIVDGKSAVFKSEAYMTKDGMLNIEVTQRKPVIRFQKQNGGFYADKEGFIFPLQRSYTSHVPIIDGAIPLKAETGFKGKATEKEQKWIDSMLELIKYMEDSRIWRQNIVQITVRPNGDLIMVPREGKEKFIFGSPDNPEEKFRRIGKYYENIVPAKGENHYTWVNVKYDNQIICRK